MLADFRRRFQPIRFDILCAEYSATSGGDDIVPIRWTDWPAAIESVRTSDCLIIGGGGLFNCYFPYSGDELLRHSGNFAPFIFGLPALACLLGKRCCIYGVGASRFFSQEALDHARMAVRLAGLCTVRDSASRAILSSGGNQFRIPIHPDPAFRLVNDPLPEDALEEAGIAGESRPLTAVVLRNWHFEGDPTGWEETAALALRDFARKHSVRLLFLPFQASSDVGDELSNDPALIARMRARIGADDTAELRFGLPPGAVSAVIAQCQMTITMRLHGAILSIRNATPFVAINYDPKVANILGECDLKRFVVPMPTESPDALSVRLDAVWAERDRIRGTLREVGRRQASNAGAHVERLASFLRKAPRFRNDARTQAFLNRLAARQTIRLVEVEAACRRAEAECESCLRAARELVNSGAFQSAHLYLSHWKPSTAVAQAEREYYLAFCLHRLERDPDAAVRHYGAALDAGFDEFWTRYHRAQLLWTIGWYGEAERDLQRACELRPDHDGASRLLRQFTGSTVQKLEKKGARPSCRPGD
jgi:polysaccharide pyruvyl transferase WcaK-like protein